MGEEAKLGKTAGVLAARSEGAEMEECQDTKSPRQIVFRYACPEPRRRFAELGCC